MIVSLKAWKQINFHLQMEESNDITWGEYQSNFVRLANRKIEYIVYIEKYSINICLAKIQYNLYQVIITKFEEFS